MLITDGAYLSFNLIKKKRMIMKRLFIVFTFLFGLMTISNADAQTYYYKTFQFAIKYKSANGVWGQWSDWESSNMTLTIDLDNDVITVYSQKRQIYRVIENMGGYTDESNGRQTKFYVIDQDGDYGYVRLRVEQSGNKQLYVDFGDVMFCWNIKRI